MRFFDKIWTNQYLKTCYSLFYSLLFLQCVTHGQTNCCCGAPKELDFPGFDFEFPPDPSPGWFDAYAAGTMMGPWDVTKGFVDHVDKQHYFNTGYGNPNGPSTFVDLFGSPKTGSMSGAIKYTLTGLIPGALYTLQFYYAKFDVPGNFIATIKVANGSWLNVNLTATNPGEVIWLKADYNFVALSSLTSLEFIDAGSSSSYGVGVLIDDIKLFECPNDIEKPLVNNPPDDVEVECDNEVPPVPTLDITDNCDAKPVVSYKETKDIIDACSKKITREWSIQDACGNITIQKQIIDVIDKSQPQFTKFPENKFVYCHSDVIKEFNDWIKKNGNGIATDACGAVSWRTVYSRLPKKSCDSLAIDFIAIDACGHEIVESVFFIVKDTAATKFLIKPQDKNYLGAPNIKDSLRAWLNSFGYSTIAAGCDTTILSSNFNGDSTKNPLQVTFYAKDPCGNVDSSTATFSYKSTSVTCCCGTPQEMNFPGLDFEFDPLPPPSGYFPYTAVSPFGAWTVTNGAIDHGDPNYCGILAGGNPNGASYFIDLFGSPPTGSVAGTLEYVLTGLTPGNTYTIEFWYATFTANGSFSANLKVANGAWLNVNWNANNPGSVIWLKNSYSFVAKASTATMSFTDTGASSSTYQIGMLLDDIKIFECPGDVQKPVVTNPPKDIEVECEQHVPNVPVLKVSDNCDPNPSITYNEIIEIFDQCTKRITRTWDIKDACGNLTTQKQKVDIIDKTPPKFTANPINKTFYCENDVSKEFNDWIKKNGNAIATDDCGIVTWRLNYDHSPNKSCDTVTVEFIAEDECGNQQSQFANFIVRDTTLPRFIVKAQNKNFPNNNNIRDSLRNWLNNYGFAKATSNCDTIILSSDFDGDSTKNPIHVIFYAKDRCGNVDTSSATFAFQSGNGCCCGPENELTYPNLDFEAPPAAPPGGWIDYSAGQNYAGWQIDAGSVSIHDAGHLNLGFGNPNGASQHMDLHGFNQGTATYTLTGLTAGNKYTISFWYAIHSFGVNVSAILKVNGGSLLNVSWSASNHGDVIWLPAMYDFIADGPTAAMTFVGTGSTPCCGMLIDDIHIFECPGDKEMPVVKIKPLNWEVECEIDIPPIPTLEVTDNCDPNPKITFNETKETIDPCSKKISRYWRIEDACGNVTLESQIITIVDTIPPMFLKKPLDKLVYCTQDIAKEFKDWTKLNGNASARDDCGLVSWRNNYERQPHNYCDTIITEFFAIDHCGNENSSYAYFIVQDSSSPKFIIKAQSKNLVCVPNSRDSLRVWLDSFGYSKIKNFCDTTFLSSSFNGDSTKNPIIVTFYAKDRCGHIDSSTATFSYRSSSDTFRITNYSCSFPQTSIDTFLFNSNGCDSIVIRQQIKTKSDSNYFQLNTCDPLQKQFDTIRLSNNSGCDSTLFYEYILKPSPVTTLQIMDCVYTALTKDTMKFSGQFCDSLVIREYIPLRKDSVLIQTNTCDKTKEGTVFLNLKNSLGCDSIVILQTTYTGQQNTFVTSKECNIQKDYTDTITIHVGFCDSLVITNHIALPKDTTSLQSNTCDKTKVGVISKNWVNQFGCDSLVIENISLLPSDTVAISKTTCNLSLAGIKVQQLKNKFNCDSIVTTTTIFTPSDTTRIDTFTCDFTKQRNDTTVIATANCDSLIITKIVFVPMNTTFINAFTCNLNQQKTDTLIIPTKFCDSMVITATKFIPSDTILINSTTCIPSQAGKDTLNLKNRGGCDSIIYTNKLFIPKALQIQLDSITCNDKSDGRISVLNSTDFTNPIEMILNKIIVSNNSSADNLSPGIYQFMVRDKNGCVSDSISFELVNPSPFITELGPEYLVDKGITITLKLNSNKIPSFIYWSPQGISSCIQCQQIDYTAEQSQWIYTLAIDDRGCESQDSILVRVREASKIFAPNAISNNGDNINDHFYLIGDDNVLIELMEIYDRWGELLFTTSNIAPNHPELGWNGMFKNEKMNPGVYVYYAKVRLNTGETRELKGDFTLIR